MTTTQEHAVDFLGHQIPCVQADDGTVYVPLKRLCEILGIDHIWQRSKVKNNGVFNGLVMSVPAKDGHHCRMFCLPQNELYGWLYMVNPNTVRPEIIEKLIRYQEESREALRNHETRDAAVNPRMIVLSPEELKTLVIEATKSVLEGLYGNKLPDRSELKQRRFDLLRREIALIEDVATESPAVRAKAQSYIEVAKARYDAWLADFEKNSSDDPLDSPRSFMN